MKEMEETAHRLRPRRKGGRAPTNRVVGWGTKYSRPNPSSPPSPPSHDFRVVRTLLLPSSASVSDMASLARTRIRPRLPRKLVSTPHSSRKHALSWCNSNTNSPHSFGSSLSEPVPSRRRPTRQHSRRTPRTQRRSPSSCTTTRSTRTAPKLPRSMSRSPKMSSSACTRP